MRMHRHYTPEEILFVKKNIRGRSYVEMTKMFNERFGLRITLKQMKRLTYGHGIRNGIGSYRPGNVPANKGKTHKPWQGCYRPIGSERLQQGYVFVKVSNRRKPAQRNWEAKQVGIWKAANGKVPKGHVVIFADGDIRNFALDNLLLISRKELMVMNHLGLIAPHKDLTALGKAVADVKLAVAERKRGKRGTRRRPATAIRSKAPRKRGTR